MSKETHQEGAVPAAFEPRVERVPCPVCGQDQPEPALKAQEYFIGTGHWFEVVRCGACGLLYTSPRPTLDTIGRYYPNNYYSEIGSVLRAVKPNFRERVVRAALRNHYGYPGKKNFWGKLLTLPVAWRLRHSRKHTFEIPWAGEGRLLDFGCGGGAFLARQKQRGWQVWGIDFSEEQAAKDRQAGLDVVAGTWPGAPLADRKFDVITGWHVLEHLPDPPAWARQAASHISPGGYVMVCCPVSDSWTFRLFGPYWYALDVPRHFSHFTRKQLAQLLTDAGLKVERIYPQVIVHTWLESARRRAEATGAIGSKVLSRSRWLCSLLARVAAWCGAGDSAVVVARKPVAK